MNRLLFLYFYLYNNKIFEFKNFLLKYIIKLIFSFKKKFIIFQILIL